MEDIQIDFKIIQIIKSHYLHELESDEAYCEVSISSAPPLHHLELIHFANAVNEP